MKRATSARTGENPRAQPMAYRSWPVLVPVISIFALLLGCQSARPASAPPAANRTVITDGVVAVGGTSLHIHCVGEGTPIVVLDSGLGNDGGVWRDVLPGIRELTRACVYDRAGMGYSAAPNSKPHTNRQMARELYALLAKAQLDGPYVLVGHSMGGMNVRLFASEHLDEVAGMVLVDAVTADQPSRYWALMPQAALVEFRDQLRKLPEGLDYETLVSGLDDMRRSSQSIGDKPLVVLTRGKEESPPGTPTEQVTSMLRNWHEMQSQLSHLSTNSVQVVAANSNHCIQWDAPRLVSASIREVVLASRTHARVNSVNLTPLDHEGDP
jgi:pimeloyl-ACP methyl ester carboxylesterase